MILTGLKKSASIIYMEEKVKEEPVKEKPKSKKIIWIVLIGVVLFVCCVVSGVLIYFLTRPSPPTPTPVVTVTEIPTPASDATGNWEGTYVVTSPSACAGTTGNWTATLVEQSGLLTGTYASDVGLNGNVSGTASGSDVSWNVGGGGGVTFTGSIIMDYISGSFTGPVCTGNTHTTGTFLGNKL